MKNKKEIIEKSTCKVDQYGTKRWYNSKGILHRDNDLPAIEYANGSKEWYMNGKHHRENDLPAVEWYDGAKYWYINNEIHRENGPASEFSDGGKAWYWHGKYIEVNSQEEFEEKLPYLIMKDIHEQYYYFDEDNNKKWFININNKTLLHRKNDLPAIEYANGDKVWYLNDKRHRENDKPAIENANGDKFWFLNGKIHRENGPASEFFDGKRAWYWHGEYIEVNSQEEFEEKLPYLIIKDIHEQ